MENKYYYTHFSDVYIVTIDVEPYWSLVRFYMHIHVLALGVFQNLVWYNGDENKCTCVKSISNYIFEVCSALQFRTM